MPTKTFLSGILSLLRPPSLLVSLLDSATLPSLSPSVYSFSPAIALVSRAPQLPGSVATVPGKPRPNPHPIAWPTQPKRIARRMAKVSRSHAAGVRLRSSFFESKLQWLVSALEAQRGAPQSLLHSSDRMALTSRRVSPEPADKQKVLSQRVYEVNQHRTQSTFHTPRGLNSTTCEMQPDSEHNGRMDRHIFGDITTLLHTAHKAHLHIRSTRHTQQISKHTSHRGVRRRSIKSGGLI